MSKALFAGFAFVLLVQAFLIAYQIFDRPFEPLGPYPTQVITNEVGPSGFPTVQTGDNLSVEARKCSKADEPVEGFASMRWETVDPAGSVFQTITGAPTTFQPGCKDLLFDNPIPVEVAERNSQLYEQGEELVVWHIVGFEQPVDGDGELGVGIQWQTQKFAITP